MAAFLYQYITIDHKDGPMTIPAWVNGNFAYHPNTTPIGSFTVTHVPTGTALASRCRDVHVARRLIAQCLESGIDWSDPDPAAYAPQVQSRPTLQKSLLRVR